MNGTRLRDVLHRLHNEHVNKYNVQSRTLLHSCLLQLDDVEEVDAGLCCALLPSLPLVVVLIERRILHEKRCKGRWNGAK